MALDEKLSNYLESTTTGDTWVLKITLMSLLLYLDLVNDL